MKNSEEIIRKYLKRPDKEKELAEALFKMIGDYNTIKEIREVRSILAHDLRGLLMKLQGSLDLLEKGKLTEEKKALMLRIAQRATSQIEELTELLYVSGFNKDSLQEKAERVSLEEIAKGHLQLYEREMEIHRIGLNLKYDRQQENPILIYINRGVITSLWGTLMCNCFSWTPDETNVNQAFKITNRGSLEIMMENEYGKEKQRDIGGMGFKIGMKTAKKIIEGYNGSLNEYRQLQIPRDYQHCERHGYQNGRNPDGNSKIHGIKILIPLREISEITPIATTQP